MGDKWTLLIVRDLISGPRRFVELQRVLPGISTEQLRSRLNRMVADGMLTRKRYREVPPRVDYELTERAHELAPVLGQLARWGHNWAWGTPRQSEAIDVGAIFRLIPGVLGDGAEIPGYVSLTVLDGIDGTPTTYELALTSTDARIYEDTPEHPAPGHAPDAGLRGSTTGWVKALGPAGDPSGLEISGSRELAEMVLDALSPDQARMAEMAAEAATS